MKTNILTSFHPVSLLITLALACGPAFAAETPQEREARIGWWREARFGMFIHWGPVSLKGTEISWSRANTNPKCPNQGPIPAAVYDNLYKDFRPTQFDADAWATVAREAGMKYIVLTAKHCDGFLLWPSKTDAYNMAATPLKTDVCAALARAARKQHLRIGWYFSPMDWRDADFRTERNAAFLARMQGELRELLGNYGPIDLLWFDWDGREPLYDQAETYKIVKTMQPQIVINNRLDLGPGRSDRQLASPQADYYTPEQHLGGYDDKRPWESCMTLGTQWAWKPNDQLKSAAQVVRLLADCAGGDGNLLLNTGPMPDGRIEPRQVEIFQAVGRWLARHGESIYGTRGGPYKPAAYGSSTRKGSVVYLHLRPAVREVTLPALPRKVTQATLLAGGEAKAEQTATELRVTVRPEGDPQGDTVVKLELDGSAMEIAAIDVKAAKR